MTRLLILFTTVSLLFMSVQVTFAASVTISPAATGGYSVQGNAIDGVSGIDLTIFYDKLSLSSPTVSQGSLVAGAVLTVVSNNSGSIKIAIKSTKAFSGSGQIATVIFATQNGTGGITSASANMIFSNGALITVPVVVFSGETPPTAASGIITSPGVPFSQPSATTTTTTSATKAPASPLPTYLDTVSVPADVQPKSDTKPADTSGVPVQFTEPGESNPIDPSVEVKPLAEPQKPVEVKMISYKGALDNFQAYKGEKSPAIFIALINREITATIRQEPAVALSDGKTPVKILVKVETTADKSPNFYLNGAKLASLTRDASFTWIIEALPRAGIMHASLTVLTDSDMIEYPLTLAPPVEVVAPSEAEFAVFLTDSGAVTPKRDLNGDGRHDYLDDFIYTANYLVRKSAAGKAK